MNRYIYALADHALAAGLIEAVDKIWAVNRWTRQRRLPPLLPPCMRFWKH